MTDGPTILGCVPFEVASLCVIRSFEYGKKGKEIVVLRCRRRRRVYGILSVGECLLCVFLVLASRLWCVLLSSSCDLSVTRIFLDGIVLFCSLCS